MTSALSALKDTKNLFRRHIGRLHRDRPSLTSVLFHSLFDDAAEIGRDAIAPQQATTVTHFREFVRHFVERGYAFVGPDDLADGLDPQGKHILVTFDDGYFNNARAVPVLEEFGVPAVFFISTRHVMENKCFWWDVLYRRRRAEHVEWPAISREGATLKERRYDEIEDRLREQFGPDALTPIGDTDRPFTPDELAEFNRSPFVHLGNHTSEHAILTEYDEPEVERLVRECQDDLRAMCGVVPTFISYPNGNYNDAVVRASRRCGLTLGISVEKRKHYPPFLEGDDARMTIGRFTLWGDADVDHQCELIRSDMWWGGRRARPRGLSRT